jgi:hypothetical protein
MHYKRNQFLIDYLVTQIEELKPYKKNTNY